MSRRKRIPMNGFVSKLAVDEAILDHEKYDYRFFNDDPGRIDRAQRAGWDLVRVPTAPKGVAGDGNEQATEDIGSSISRPATGATKCYLMQTLKSFRAADEAERNRQIDEIEQEIKSGDYGNNIPARRRNDKHLTREIFRR